MKKLAFFVLIAVFFAACEKETIEPQVQNEEVQLKSANKPGKVKIWHLKGNGEYVLIEVAQSAVDAHLAHGDMLYCEPDFYQGFEKDASGWFDGNSGWYGTVTRMEETSSDTASFGSWYALIEGDATSGPFTRFDGYSDTWPENGWTAEVDVYLDPSWADGTGFDYSVAATGSDGNHLQDFIFHVSKISGEGLFVAGSNNSNFAPILNLNTWANSYKVEDQGWYTLEHKFYNDGGILAVDLNLVDAKGNILFTETRTTPANTIPDVVGGNRYGWFTFINVPDGIKVDETELYRGCAPM